MLLGRMAFRFFTWNIYLFVNRFFGGFEGWSKDDYKARLGVSKETIDKLIKDTKSSAGHREVQLKTITVICKATGIRLDHMISQAINMKTYMFDTEMSRLEFRAHVSKLGVSPQFGLDKLNKVQGNKKCKQLAQSHVKASNFAASKT